MSEKEIMKSPNLLEQGIPIPTPWTSQFGTWSHSGRWTMGYSQPLPITRITAWALHPVRPVAVLDFHRSVNPTVNCACKGSTFRTFYENLMPHDLRWSWGSDASTEEWMKMFLNLIIAMVTQHSEYTMTEMTGEGNGTPLQYSCLENPMDRGAWWAAVHGVAKSRTWLRDFTFTFHFHALEKEMVTHSSVLAWRIPGTGEPGGLPSMGSHRVGHDWSDLALWI